MRRAIPWLTLVVLAVSCLPSHAIVLRYRPKKGMVVKHKITMSSTASVSVPDMPTGPQKMKMTGYLITTQKVLDATPSTCTVETRITSGKITMNVAGQTESVDMPQGRIVAEMDDRGRTVKVIDSDMGEASPGEAMGAPFDFSDFAEFGAAFPDGDLKVNDTWTGTMKISLEEGMDMTVTARSRLLELTTFQGRKCAKIRSSFKGPMAVSVPAEETGGHMNMTGTLTGQFVTYYDYENSVYVASEGTFSILMKMSGTSPEGEPIQVKTSMTMEMKTKLL